MKKRIEKPMAQNESSSYKESTISSGFSDIIFDWKGLLHRLMGDEDLAKEIIDDFLKQIPKNLIAVKEALHKKDMALVQSAAHIIKGASGNVGALALQEIAEQIEIAGAANDLGGADSLVKQLDAQLEILKNELDKNLE